MTKQKTLLLINPISPFHGYLSRYASFRCPPLSLAILAALTPGNWRIKILDETVRPCSFEGADLVGITSFTATAPRAYEIAQTYREKQVPVVIGGVHASICPEEAGRYADSVVIGNADDTWPRLLQDFESHSLKPVYRCENAGPSLKYPLPRHDLIPEKYDTHLVQSSIGCPNHCDFCVVPSLYGNRYRRRDADDVIKELLAIKARSIFFVDENFHGITADHRATAIEICKAMIKTKANKYWTFQAPVSVAEDEELLTYAKKAGCRSILIGFESLDAESLSSVNKRSNLSRVPGNYADTVKKIHKKGMAVFGMFMCGFDMDNPDIVKQRARKIAASAIDCYQFSVISPFPGTKIYDKIKAQDRLLYTNYPHDWIYYDGFHPVFKPKNCTSEELLKSLREAHSIIYGLPVVFSKIVRSLLSTRSPAAMMDAAFLNIGYSAIRNFIR